jgi:hypothetical protein
MSIITAWHRLQGLHLRGTWRPGAHNVVLLIAQVVLLWSAAQRGLDYFNLPDIHAAVHGGEVSNLQTLRGIEEDVPLKVLGLAFLIPAGFGFFGLATGWAKALSLGHLFIGAAYLILGITFLRDTPIASVPYAVGGCALLVLAAVLLVADSRVIPDVVAFVVGLAAMVLGGWLASHGLGYGYRTGNGFLGGAVLHFTFGFGTQILAQRAERLKREEEEDFQALALRS